MKNDDLFLQLKQVEYANATMEDVDSIVLDKASGSLLLDVEGNEYIDLCAGFGSLPLGHNHPCVQASLQRYIGHFPAIMQGLGDVYSSKDKLDLLQFVRGLLPTSLEKGGLVATGSQAVELALRTASLFNGGNRFICFSGAYHGLDLGVLPLAGREDFGHQFHALQPSYRTTRLKYGCSRENLVQAIMQATKESDKVAAVVVEPILGRGGVCLPPKGWLLMVSQVCREHDVILIFDEILTGLGRTGVLCHADIPFDMLCLGKAIGGGLPLASCFGTEEVMDAWPSGCKESSYTGTFFGHPLSCHVGLVTLKKVLNDNLAHRAFVLGEKILKKLRNCFCNMSWVKEVRGQGLMIAVEFNEKGYGVEVMKQLRSRGVVAIPSGVDGSCLSLTPALNINEKMLFSAIEQVVKVVTQLTYR